MSAYRCNTCNEMKIPENPTVYHPVGVPCPYPHIAGKPLAPNDIGREVTYTPDHGDDEYGVLSSYRFDGAIFVRFKGPNGENCPPEALSWGHL